MAHVIDRDLGFRALRIRLEQTRLHAVTVGIHAQQGNQLYDPGTPLTIAEIAEFHEFGTSGGVPERSFMRATIDEKREEIRGIQRTLARRVLSNRERLGPKRALSILGLAIESMIKARIRAGIPPQVKPATLARKRSSIPLIDTGQLIQSITFEVK